MLTTCSYRKIRRCIGQLDHKAMKGTRDGVFYKKSLADAAKKLIHSY